MRRMNKLRNYKALLCNCLPDGVQRYAERRSLFMA